MLDSRTNDPFPTARCDEARARVIETHKAYLQLLRNKPTHDSIEVELHQEEEEEAKAIAGAPKPDESLQDAVAPTPAMPGAYVEAAAAHSVIPGEGVPTPIGGPQSEMRDPMVARAADTAELAPDESPEPAMLVGRVPGVLEQSTIENLQGVARRPRATAERNRLEKFRRDSGRARFVWIAALYVVGGWMAYGLGSVLGRTFQEQVLSKLQLVLPAAAITIPIVAVLAVLIAFSSWGLARSQQLFRMATKAPRDIPFVDNVGHIYEIEMYGGEVAEEADAKKLEKKLDTLRKTLIAGKSVDETKEDLKLYQAFFGVIVLIFTVPNVLFYPHGTVEEGILAFLVAGGPVAFAFFFSMLLANHTVDWPKLTEELMDPSVAQGMLTKHDQRLKEAVANDARAREEARKAEAKVNEEHQRALERSAQDHKNNLELAERERERLERERRAKTEELQKEETKRARALVREQTVKLRLEVASKRYESDARDKLAELREAANAFENERGYSKREQAVMGDELSKARLLFRWLLIPMSVASGLFATYPASLTVNEIFDMRFQYVFQNRFAFIPWVVWFLLIGAGEWLMISSLHRRRAAEDQYRVLDGFYDEMERLHGLRYRFKTWVELQAERKGARNLMIAGCCLLLLEFSANAYYLVKNSDATPVLAVLLALVPFALFVGLTIPHAQSHHKRHRLSDALAWAKSLKPPADSEMDDRNKPPGTSAQIKDTYERMTGWVDTAAPKREG